MLKQRKSRPWRWFGYLILISMDFDDFTSPFTPQFLFRLRRYIKHSRQWFSGYSNTSNFVKNTPLCVVFSTLFSVFGYPDETLSFVFDINITSKVFNSLFLLWSGRGIDLRSFFYFLDVDLSFLKQYSHSHPSGYEARKVLQHQVSRCFYEFVILRI